MDIIELNIEQTETQNRRLRRCIQQKKGTLQIPACLFVFMESDESFRSGFANRQYSKMTFPIMVNYIEENKNFTLSICM